MRLRLRAWLTRLWVHYIVQANPRAKCPACGHRKTHKIEWDTTDLVLRHTCSFCGAVFGEKPVMIASAWTAAIKRAEPEPEKLPTPPMYVSRNPTIISAKAREPKPVDEAKEA